MFKKFAHIRITIGKRVFFGFGVVLLLILAQALVGNLGFENVGESFTHYRESNRSVRDTQEMQLNLLDHQRGVLAYTYSGYEGLADRVRELESVLSEQVKTAKQQEQDDNKAQLLRQMDDQLQLYKGHFKDAIDQRILRDDLAFTQLLEKGEAVLLEMDGMRQRMLASDDEKGAYLASQAQTHIALIQRNALHFLLRPNSRLVRDTQQDLDALKRAIDDLVEHNGHKESKELLPSLITLSETYDTTFNGMVQATRAYLHLVYVVMGGEAGRIGYLARKLEHLSTSDQASVETLMSELVDDTRGIMEWVSVLAVLLGLFLAWRISRNISNPIEAMTRSLTSLARGKMDSVIPGKGRNDEIGAMAKAANVFKEKAHELENASRYKSEFLANMSHELRTPLNSMLILSRVLAQNETGKLDADQVESAEVIHESGTDLLRLINDILDLSKVEAGRMELYAEDKAFEDLRRTLERLFQPVAEQKGLSFSVTLDSKVPTELYTDWAKVEQIIRNFLSNAFKFTSRGFVKVSVELPQREMLLMHPELSTENSVAIIVQDSGIGIPEDKLEQVFEAFRQVDGTTSRKYGGTGLGLSISRRFAELLGGEIQVDSAEGEGSKFTLFLPLQFPDTDSINHQRISSTINGIEHKAEDVQSFKDLSRIILMADDDSRNLFAMKRMLDTRVGRILTAGNGREAIEILNEHPDIDLVLMDIMMPEMNGYEAMESIRRQSRFSKLPIIALTAKAMPGDREKCLNAGASDYIAKPVDVNKLFQSLSEWLSKPKLPVEVQQQYPSDEAILPKVRIVEGNDGEASLEDDLQPLSDSPPTILIVDDDMRNSFSLARVLERKAKEVVIANDGIRALEKLQKTPDINLILMDIMMPQMDGYEAIQKIRQLDSFRNVPIIVLTAKEAAGEVDKCLSMGANDFVTKPVKMEFLVRKIRHWLNAGTDSADINKGEQ